MVFVILAIFLVKIILTSAVSQNAPNGCTVNIASDIQHPDPLILKPNFSNNDAFIYPDLNGEIKLNLNDEIFLACPGRNNSFETPDLDSRQVVTIKCSANNRFSINDSIFFDFDEFICKQFPESHAIRSGNVCSGNKTDVNIGFEVENSFVILINVCFDESLMTTVYSFANMSQAVQLGVESVSRPDFRPEDFFSVPIDSLYHRENEQNTFAFLLGSQELAEHYIHPSDNFFLSRGHFSAMDDYVYGSQQRSTFFYINAAPQWQVFNGGNWLVIESSCQKYATENQKNLQVYTGGFDIAALKDINGNDQKLYLFAEEGANFAVPVPKFYWKVVYHPSDKAGVAFIGLNNPYEFDEDSDVFCQDVCDQISWVHWKQRQNLTLGYSFCCDVNEFRKTVTVLPKFDVEKLLK